jgi:PAS domain S-box-containing protein
MYSKWLNSTIANLEQGLETCSFEQMKSLTAGMLSMLHEPGSSGRRIERLLEAVEDSFGLSRILVCRNSIDLTQSSVIFYRDTGQSGSDAAGQLPVCRLPSLSAELALDEFAHTSPLSADAMQNLTQEQTEQLARFRFTSALIYPLVIQGKTAGFICFERRPGSPQEHENTHEPLNTLSRIISTLVEERCQGSIEGEQTSVYREFLDTVDDMMMITDSDGFLVYTNPAVTHQLGYSASELVGAHMLSLHPDTVRAEANTVFLEMLEGRLKVCTLPLARKDGITVPVESRIWKSRRLGKPAVYCISKNISELQTALRKFNTLFYSSPVLMVLASREKLEMLDFNQAFEEITGFSRESALGKTPWELGLFRDTPERVQELLCRITETPSFRNVEHQFQTSTKGCVTGLFSGAAVDAAGTPAYLVTMTDISEVVLLKQKVEEEKRQLKFVIESTATGIWIWNLVDNSLIVNEQWANMLGYTLDELRPLSFETWNRLTHPDDIAHVMARLEVQLAGSDDPYSSEFRMRCKDGSWVWVLAHATVAERDRDGRPLTLYGTHIDITKRKMEEISLKNTLNRTIKSIEDKALFMAQITHDIKTPLNVIHGLNELLLNTETSPTQKEYLGKIRRASQTLMNTIANLLDFSRIEAGKFSSEQTPFSVRETVSRLCELYLLEIERKHLHLRCTISDDLPCLLYGDEQVLHHILQNLIDNAVKYTDSGTVGISVRAAEPEDDTCLFTFEVSDTGRGIDAEDLLRIFDPYSRVISNQPYLSRNSGSGLGLSISRDLAAGIGGELTVESALGEGSLFTLTVPLTVLRSKQDRKRNMTLQGSGAHPIQPEPESQKQGEGVQQPHNTAILREKLSQLASALELGDTQKAALFLQEMLGNEELNGTAVETGLQQAADLARQYRYDQASVLVRGSLKILEKLPDEND